MKIKIVLHGVMLGLTDRSYEFVCEGTVSEDALNDRSTSQPWDAIEGAELLAKAEVNASAAKQRAELGKVTAAA